MGLGSKAACYSIVGGRRYDRILDIFIRANSGGSPLSRSDLLMSVITLRWEQFNARDETERLIEDLTELLSPKRALNREFVLRPYSSSTIWISPSRCRTSYRATSACSNRAGKGSRQCCYSLPASFATSGYAVIG